MSELTHVKGLAELQKMLDTLPAKIERNFMRQALRAGARVIEAEAKANCPVGPPSAQGAKRYKLYAGALRDSIRSGVYAKGGRVTAYVRAGGKNKKTGADVWYAYFIEYSGAVAHIIKAAAGKVLAIGGGLYRSVEHPGMSARPFLRPALDSQARNATVASAEYIKRRLESKHGLDASGINIGGAL